MNWYYAIGGQQTGPIPETEFDALIRAGTVRADTLVWREGMDGWKTLAVARPEMVPTSLPPVASATGDGVVCSQCGQIFGADQVIKYGEMWVCAGCKPAFVQKLKEGINLTQAFRYAGFWIRVGAKMIDGLVMGAVLCIPMIGIVFMMGINSGGGNRVNPLMVNVFSLLIQLVAFAAQIVYSTIFLGRFGATPGKMACGLRVVNADGSKLSYAKAFGRSCAEILSGIVCYIGYIIVGFDDQKRSLHDRICDTRVIYKQKE